MSHFLHLIEYHSLPADGQEGAALGSEDGVGGQHDVFLEELPQSLELVPSLTRAPPPLALLRTPGDERAVALDVDGGGEDGKGEEGGVFADALLELRRPLREKMRRHHDQ
eukprot:250109-Hanusia_phi.AAC.1